MTDTEKAALERRIDELCAKVEQGKAENAKLVDVLHEVEQEAIYAYHCLQQDCVTTANSSEHFFKKWWHAECELDRAKAENAKLRELVARMAEALGIDCEWADPNWCKSPCVLEFECWPESDHTELRCPAWAIMHELGIEVPE